MGDSGASLYMTYRRASATKIAPVDEHRRVARQGGWILQHQRIQALPRIHAVDDTRNSYTMELLYPVPWGVVDTTFMLDHIVAILEETIWSEPAKAEFDKDAHIAKRDGILHQFDDPKLSRLVHSVNQYAPWLHDHGVTGLTHGDPTFSNIMLRHNGDLVLTDPIIATPAIPDFVAADLGVILQSLLGFERVRFDWDLALPDIEDFWDVVGEELKIPAVYWCIFKLLRALPYVPQQYKEDVKELMYHARDLI